MPVLSTQAVEERKTWSRFGDARIESKGDSVTAQSLEEIPFERVRQQKQTQEERKQDLQKVLQGSDKGAIVSKSATHHFPAP
jgi:hypothetical protein